MTDTEVVLAIDVGGTKTLLGVVDRDGRILAEHRVATRDATSRFDDLSRVLQAVVDLEPDWTRLGTPVGVGAGFPEYVSPDGQLRSREVISWGEQPGRALSDTLRAGGLEAIPVRVDSDVRLGARGEAWLGAGRGVASFLYVSLGTGLSTAMVIDSQPWPGAHGEAIGLGEWPAPVLPGEHPVRNLERFASGAGIAERYLARTGTARTTRDLTERPDADALAVLTSAGEALGQATAALDRVLDPEMVILGGGLGVTPGPLHEALVSAHVSAGGHAPIRTAALGSRSAMVGAAALAWAWIPAGNAAT